MKVYIDGSYFSREDAKISVYDHGLLYGDGVFEGIRIYGGIVLKLKEHLERLYRSASALMIKIPLNIGELEDAVIAAVKANDKINGYIRLVVTRGVGSLGLDPAHCARPSIIIIVDDISLYPKECYEHGIKIITASSRKYSADSLDPRIKSLNYLNNIMAKIEAKQAGCLEAVMLNREGYVAECTGDNIFFMSNGILCTPQASCGALDGITKGIVMDLAAGMGIITVEKQVTLYDLYTGDECFLTGTGAEIMPVVGIDGRVIGNGKPGSISIKLMELYKNII